jgi:hypothetical protein
VKTSDHVNYLTIVDENRHEQVIETTDGHPFWVVTDTPDLSRAAKDYSDGMYHGNLEITENGFWVEAKDLRVGDVFLGANGELSVLVDSTRVEFDGNIAVYNFSIDGNHDYFVIAKGDYGQTCVLVHNAGGIYIFDDLNDPGKKYVGQARKFDQRLPDHKATGRINDVNDVVKIEMPDADKTAREIAEHLKIQEITGGVPARHSDLVSNLRDPIGPARIYLLK